MKGWIRFTSAAVVFSLALLAAAPAVVEVVENTPATSVVDVDGVALEAQDVQHRRGAPTIEARAPAWVIFAVGVAVGAILEDALHEGAAWLLGKICGDDDHPDHAGCQCG